MRLLGVGWSGNGPDPGPAGAHPIFRVAHQEDSGSDTLGNYRYQAEVADQICVALLTQDSADSVVCEWHEASWSLTRTVRPNSYP